LEIGDWTAKVRRKAEISNLTGCALSRLRSALRFALLSVVAVVFVSSSAEPHDIITTPVTWNREISRIFYSRCVACHREGGSAFSMAEYKETFPWRTAIKEEVLERRMPPWGAVKGFGDFSNDQALTPEQLELLTSWAQGGSPEGEAKDLASKDKLDEMMKESAWYRNPMTKARHMEGEILAREDYKLTRRFILSDLRPQNVPENGSFQIVAESPDGRIEPLVWLDGYKEQFGHWFSFREPIDLPAGTVIRGIPAGSSIALLPSGH
jgi:hypothetical protein